MKFGDELILRETNERVVLLGIINDEAGILLVATPGEEPYEVHEDDIMTLGERHSGCGCC